MEQRKEVIFTIAFCAYVLTILLTDISLSGFWTDMIASIVFIYISIKTLFNKHPNNIRLSFFRKAINTLCSLLVIGSFGPQLVDPYIWSTLNLRSFLFQSVDGRLFNAYFKPVGAYSGGYGNFWVAETPKYFPVVEWPVYWERAVHHDFNDDTFDGKPINNYEMARIYIKENVTHPIP